MSYAIRNTLIISIFWTLLLGAGFYYVYGHQGKSLDKLLKVKATKTKELEQLRKLEKDIIEMQNYLTRLIEISEGKEGVLVSEESPGETYDYILRELKRTNSSLYTSLSYVKKDTISMVERSIYELKGEGKFADLYKLLWFMENGPVFYSLKSLEIDRFDTDNEKLSKTLHSEVNFLINLESFNQEKGPKLSEMSHVTGEPQKVAHLIKKLNTKFTSNLHQQPSYTAPKTASYTRTQHKSGYTNINPTSPKVTSTSQLLAVTRSSVLIKTGNGKTLKLRKGDKINGGYLRDIKPSNSQAIFEMRTNTGSTSLVLTVTTN